MRRAAIVVVVVGVVVLSMTSSSGYVAGTIARVGDPNPQGGTFQILGRPQINSAGQVAFVADWSPFLFATLYRYDHSTASVSTVFQGYFSEGPIAINDVGQIAFSSALPTVALVRWENGVNTDIVRAGDPTPLGGTFTYFCCNPNNQGALNNNGELVFGASYVTTGGSPSGGVFAGNGVTTRAIGVLGEPTPIGGTFSVFNYQQLPVMNDNGDVLFLAGVSGVSSAYGLFLSRNGVIEKVMAAGEPTPIGGFYTQILGNVPFTINNSGEVAFIGILEDGRGAIFRWKNGVTTTVASSDNVGPLGLAFLGLRQPVLNAAGALAFSGTGYNSEALYVEYQGVIRAVLDGSAPPGSTIEPGLFEGAFDFNDRGDFAVNSSPGALAGGLFFLRAEADVSVTKGDNPDPGTVGNPLTYTIAVTNNGPDIAFGVTLNDTLPAGVSFVSSSTTQGSCNGTSSVICNIGAIVSGATAMVTIVVTPTVQGGLLNTATATSLALDAVPANNSDSEATAVVAAPPPPPPPSGSVGGSVSGVDSVHVECRNLSRRRRLAGSSVIFDLPPGVTSWDCEAQGLIVATGDQIEIKVTAVAN